MRDGMTRLETYTSEIEAEMVKGRLEALGVMVVLAKDNCGGMRPHLDLQAGIKLFVADDQLDKARDILASEPAPSTGTWMCAGCGEKSEGRFDTCWQCGRDRE
jgi:hypothetical protein